jgi:hypothetical protein
VPGSAAAASAAIAGAVFPDIRVEVDITDRDAETPESSVGVEDLARFADIFSDLADQRVMSQARQ